MNIYKLISLVVIGLFIWGLTYDHSQEYQEIKRDIAVQSDIRERVRASEAAKLRFNNRVQKVERYLSGTPLEGTGKDFVECADFYGFHPGLLVGIARVESTLGRYYALTNNPWNYGIYLGLKFPSIRAGACHVAQKLRENYDTSSVYSIAVKYAPSSDGNSPTHWTSVVQDTINNL